jgi:hypothetical protein
MDYSRPHLLGTATGRRVSGGAAGPGLLTRLFAGAFFSDREQSSTYPPPRSHGGSRFPASMRTISSQAERSEVFVERFVIGDL